MILCLWSPLHPLSKLLAIQDHTQNLEEQLWMGGRREVSIIFYRPVTRSDLKQERSFFRGSVSSFLQLVAAVRNNEVSVKRGLSVSMKSAKPTWPTDLLLRLVFLFDILYFDCAYRRGRKSHFRWKTYSKMYLKMNWSPSKTPGAYSWEFLVGMYRRVLEILTLLQ